MYFFSYNNFTPLGFKKIIVQEISPSKKPAARAFLVLSIVTIGLICRQ
jgi:hypothetical protein